MLWRVSGTDIIASDVVPRMLRAIGNCAAPQREPLMAASKIILDTATAAILPLTFLRRDFACLRCLEAEADAESVVRKIAVLFYLHAG